ncbi:MAG: acylphosphatase [Thermodesulfovibrio sp.]|nr:acylphosphatase [Thermodesulfovibrio sp.]
MNIVRAHLLIEGRVQGVFYRAFTRDVALKLHLQGWVRNTPDGRVEAVIEGSRERVEQAVEECRRGPVGSAVKGMSISWDESPEGHSDFEIRY